MTKDPNEQSLGMDRRTLIKRGAAAGALAWSAPLMTAQAANALPATTCTPKCAPNEFFNLQIFGLDLCADTVGILPPGFCPPNANKVSVFILRPQLIEGGCPCGGTPEAAIVDLPSDFRKYSQATEGASPCVLSNPSGTKFTATAIQDASILNGLGNYTYEPGDAAFWVCKSGANPNGWLAPAPGSNLCFAVGCPDAKGNIAWQVCKFNGGFFYSPAGNCETLTPINRFCISRECCEIQCTGPDGAGDLTCPTCSG